MPSINCFNDHAPKPEWIPRYFQNMEQLEQSDLPLFLADQLYLGPDQVTFFARFLRESGLVTPTRPYRPSKLARLGQKMRPGDPDFYALLWINLATVDAQIRWYIQNLRRNRIYDRQELDQLLDVEGVTPRTRGTIVRTFGRFCALPFGTTMKMGFVELNEKNRIERMGRTSVCLGERGALVMLALLEALKRRQQKARWSFAELCVENEEPLLPMGLFLWDENELGFRLRALERSHPQCVRLAPDLDWIEIDPDIDADRVIDLFWETLS